MHIVSTLYFMKKANTNISVSLALFISCIIIHPLAYSDEPKSEDFLHLGGALRFNLVSQQYELPTSATSTYATFDTWRINVRARHSDISLNFEYRFYPTFNTHFIHHGYLGYNFSQKLNMQLGVTQVPFGNLTYNSHSWWFLTNYYLGLEDDYNMGLKFSYDPFETLNIMAAYFRQSAPAGPAYGGASFGGPGPGTYSYNIIPDEDGSLSPEGIPSSIRELNMFNLRVKQEIWPQTYLGLSGQLKGIYNEVLDNISYGHAWAAHLDSDFNMYNLKLQFTGYHYKALDNEGNSMSRVQMGAYGDPYYGDGVAAVAKIISAGLARNIPVKWGPISNVQAYVNYAWMKKNGQIEVGGVSYDFEDSHMLVPGLLLTAGNVFTYIDFALGKNQPWLTDDFGKGLGAGHRYSSNPQSIYYLPQKAGQPVPVKEMDWNLRFNVNIGYYF